ncbi:hypothetical protein K2173_018879 [Erythroxylum novogranatense]|uniref:N-acetyltransferase domain-containing protein n=1 Tax=Erythroxylum novogranatense TaxID=1862640 RepID=A0AAV8SBG9_9ROSI|nr:hypothetical protein K2173_018879 [Erythroxylum novogranatense]
MPPLMIRGNGHGVTSRAMEISWVTRKENGKRLLKPRIPICISTNPSQIKLKDLMDLYGNCNHSCHRFPKLDPRGKFVEAVDVKKLGVALSHSFVLVSVFCNPEDVGIGLVNNNYSSYKSQGEDPCPLPPPPSRSLDFFSKLKQPIMPVVSPSDSRLVGFGRAVSDVGLTASIYDVMVLPSMRRMGIGSMIVKRIVRMLTSRGIYDIAVLCSANERLFFKACGFGDDILGSTTMMYTRTFPIYSEGDQMITCAGQNQLLAPPENPSNLID